MVCGKNLGTKYKQRLGHGKRVFQPLRQSHYTVGTVGQQFLRNIPNLDAMLVDYELRKENGTFGNFTLGANWRYPPLIYLNQLG